MTNPGRNSRTSGQSLILVLLLLSLVGFILGLFVWYLASHLNFTARRVGSVTARAMAQSGVEYALHQLRYGDWLLKDKPIRFLSPEIDGRGTFELRIEELDNESQIRIHALGRDSFSGARKVITVTVMNPLDITDSLLTVLNYDYELRGLLRSANCVFGSDGVGAMGLIQELHTVNSYPTITLLASSDPSFGGIAPGSDYVVEDSGQPLTRTNKLPLRHGLYSIDYSTGQIQFDASESGRRILVIYDYLRKVPAALGYCHVTLPYAPVREGSDSIPGMRRTPETPTMKGTYQPDYANGVLRFSDRDAGALVQPQFAFLGTRMTGSIRVNGDAEWHGTCLLYLFGSMGQKVSTSGRMSFGPQCKLTAWNDDGRYGDLQSWKGSLAVEGAPELRVFAISTDWLRKSARQEDGSCLYINNPLHTEYRSRRSEGVTSSSDSVSSYASFDWSKYMPRLYHDWSVPGGEHWHNGVYSPPAEMVDLSSIFPGSLKGDRGLVFAEGNLIVRGSLPDGKQLVVASAKNIYIEDNIGRSMTSTLVLIAEGNICINLSKLQPQQSGSSPISLYVNCVACARRGSLAVIPGAPTGNSVVMHGAFFVNRLYPNSEWAKSFSSIEWIHDPSFSMPPKIPTQLVAVTGWEE